MSIVCRPQIVIPMMPGLPGGPGRTPDSASAQVSSRTRGWEVRVRLETCALAKNGEAGSSSPAQHFLSGGVRRRLSSAVVADADAVSRPGCGRGGPGRGRR